MRVIWFAGWYPTHVNPHSGNFIRRHFWAMSHAKVNQDSLQLVHLAPYYWRESKPEKVQDELTPYLNECIVPVPQFKSLGKLVNILVYYAYALRIVARLQTFPIDLVHVHAADKIGWVAAWFKFAHQYTLYLTEHWAIFNQPVSDPFEKRSVWFQSNYRFLWKLTNVCARINQDLHAQMSTALRSEKEHVEFPNVLDPAFEGALKEDLERLKSKDQQSRRICFLHISNGEDRKNVPALLQAFSQFLSLEPEAELTLIGANWNKKGRDPHNVHYINSLPSEQLIPYYQNASALILVSDAENAPCVLLEAHCFGIPTIVTLVGGVAEICRDFNAIQIPAFQTPEEKAEKIFEALLQFKNKRIKFDSLQIHQDAMQHYRGKVVAENLWNSYRDQTCVV